jgi:TetR/AcrR family transcriptional repressor of nem operon
MRPQVFDFFQIHLDWLGGVLDEGLAAGALRPTVPPAQVALLLLSTLEGGTFVGWALAQKAPVLAAFEAALHNIEIPVQRN